MEIKFKKMTITNFKGVIGKREITFNDEQTQILGANHTGKTTTADAAHWLLFDKSSEGATQFGIDPKDEWGNVMHNLENEVELVMVADGKEHTLLKSRKEVWTKPKQQEEAVLTSHTTSYFVDGNKLTEKDYKEYIGSLISEDLFRAITNPTYFPTLKPDMQRQLLTKMVGQRDMSYYAQGNEEFEALLKEMGGQDLKVFRQQIAYRIQDLKKEIGTYPSRIDERREEIVKIEQRAINFEKLEKVIAANEVKIAELQEEMIDKGKVGENQERRRDELRREIVQLRRERDKVREEIENENSRKLRQHDQDVQKAKMEVDSCKQRIGYAEREIAQAEHAKSRMELRKQDFRKRWQECEDMVFTLPEYETICPTCGQDLPQDVVAEKREAAERKFNERKAKIQDELDIEAKSIKAQEAKDEATIASARKRKTEEEEGLKKAEEYYEGSIAMTVETTDYAESEQYISLTQQIAQATQRLEEMETPEEAAEKSEIAEMKKEMQQLRTNSNAMRDMLNLKKQKEYCEQRIEELEAQHRKLQQQLTDLEKKEYQAAKLNDTMISDLERSVNELFTLVRFSMFKTMMNGNVEPTCVCTMHGTPYRDLSNSEKINAGLDIINAMSLFKNAYAPIFVDNAESINDVLQTKSQQILLIVSRDPELTIIN